MVKRIMPQISVIVPNYNHAKYLKQRIDSILAQTYQDFELIILDDCSTDDSREVIELYRNNPKVSHVVYNTENSGSTFMQWEKGIKLAQGEYIWIAESDDWAEASFLEIMLNEIQKNEDTSLAYSIPKYTSEDGTLWKWQQPVSESTKTFAGIDFISKELIYNSAVHNASTAIFRKSAYENIESKQYQSMKLCGDWFFYVLLAEQGNVLEVSRHLSYFRRHEKSVASTAEKNGLSLLEGIDVLNYICDNHNEYLNKWKYSLAWAKQWAKSQKQYHFSIETEAKIKNKVCKNQKMIYLFYLIYKMKYGTK